MKLYIQDIQEELIKACSNGNLDRIKYLLASPQLLNHADINHKGLPLFIGCTHRKYEVVKYLLSSPELEVHADITYRKEYCNYCFNIACSYGLLDIVNFMAESPLLKQHAKMNEYTIAQAACNNQIEVLQYLNTKFNLNDYFNVFSMKTIIDMNNETLLEFLVKSCGVRANEEVIKLLEEPYNPPPIGYIGGESHYLICELFKKKALNLFLKEQHVL